MKMKETWAKMSRPGLPPWFCHWPTNLWCHCPQIQVQTSKGSAQGPAWLSCCLPLQPHLLYDPLPSALATLHPFHSTPPWLPYTCIVTAPTVSDNLEFSNISCYLWPQFFCIYCFFCPLWSLYPPTPQTVFEHQLGTNQAQRTKKHSSCPHELIGALLLPLSLSLPPNSHCSPAFLLFLFIYLVNPYSYLRIWFNTTSSKIPSASDWPPSYICITPVMLPISQNEGLCLPESGCQDSSA